MKYLLCYDKYLNGPNGKVITEEFDDFAEAVKAYTLACGMNNQVVLADTANSTIIRQYAKDWQKDGGITICIK